MIQRSILDFDGNVRQKLTASCNWLRENPGATLIIPAGEYVLNDERAIEIMNDVYSGAYGENPQPTMFSPDFRYTKGLDLTGCRGVTVMAYGAVLIINGFMEPVSIRDAKDVMIAGLTIDHLRKPYCRGVVTKLDEDGMAEIEFDSDTPATEKMAAPRAIFYDKKSCRICVDAPYWPHARSKRISGNRWIANMKGSACREGYEIYVYNTFHARPGILISHSENTRLVDVTIHSQPGMGIVGFKSRDIEMTRLHITPAEGFNVSTNTDGTHFSSCSGTVSMEASVCQGQGDDAINIQSYYYTVTENSGENCIVRVLTPDGTHSQEPDYPLAGYRLQLVDSSTLYPIDEYTVISSSETEICRLVLDHPLPDRDNLMFGNFTDLPKLVFRGNYINNHLARSVLCKTHNAVIENNRFEGCTGTAVHIAAEGSWGEGIASENVVVRNNIFTHCGYTLHGTTNHASAVSLNIDADDSTGVGIHKNIVIENNIIECPYDTSYAFNISNAEDVVIRNNCCNGCSIEAAVSYCRNVNTDIPDEKIK